MEIHPQDKYLNFSEDKGNILETMVSYIFLLNEREYLIFFFFYWKSAWVWKLILKNKWIVYIQNSNIYIYIPSCLYLIWKSMNS